jgi:hypothetical protein
VYSCKEGFKRSNNSCVSSQICTPNQSSSQSCSVGNGSGSQSRTCNSDGSAWGSFGACTATGCNSGFTLNNGRCIQSGARCAPSLSGYGTCGSGTSSIYCRASGGESYGVTASCGNGCSGTVTVSNYGSECGKSTSKTFPLGTISINNSTMNGDPCPGTPKSARVTLNCQ